VCSQYCRNKFVNSENAALQFDIWYANLYNHRIDTAKHEYQKQPWVAIVLRNIPKGWTAKDINFKCLQIKPDPVPVRVISTVKNVKDSCK